MKTKWVSIKRLKLHEFHTTLRRLRSSDAEILHEFELLGAMEANAIKSFSKLYALLISIYFFHKSLETLGELSLTFSEFRASIPAGFLLAFSGYLFFLSTLHLNHLSAAASFRIGKGVQLLRHGISPEMYRVLLGQSDSALGIPFSHDNFLKYFMPLDKVFVYLLILVTATLLIPFAAIGAYFIVECTALVSNPDSEWVERVASTLGTASIGLGFLTIIIFHLPLPAKKNQFAIRWGFLARLHQIGAHPQIDEWLNERK